MICRDKIGNLHTSYEKMNDSYHLKAFFGVNVSCAMNEVLKFPGLFKLEDTKEYLDSVIVTPKKKSITYVEHTSYLSPKYLAEEEAIKPKLLSISNTGDGIFYFYFDQHFAIYDKKKYKVQVNVVDKSTTKALDAKDSMIKSNKVFSKVNTQEEITEAVTEQALYIAALAESIQQKQNPVYISFLRRRTLDVATLQEISRSLKKDIKYIDDRINTKSGIITTPKIEIDEEFFKYSINKTLNQEFWSGDNIKTSVRERLLKIAREYFKSFDILRGVKIEEIIFHGSLANYHYDSYSDIDLQILFDFNKVPISKRDLRTLFNERRKEMKDRYKISGYSVELQIHDIEDIEKNGSSGIYSILNNQWIKKPQILDKAVNRQEVIQRVQTAINDYNTLIEKNATQNEYKNLLQTLRTERTRAFMRQRDEYAVENETFKVLRRSGFINSLELRAEGAYKYSAPSAILSFEKEFSKEVSFNFKEERDNDLSADKFPNLPKVRFFNRNNINYLLKNKIKTRIVDSIPSFESSYSKKHSYDYEQTLKNKAAGYNIDFVNKIDDPYVTETQDFVVKNSNEAVYVLNGHNNNNVTAENFVPLQEVRQNLQPNSTYLCKTDMVESENQYFILEI